MDRGSWIANSWVVDRRVGFAVLVVLVSPSWFCRVESWVMDCGYWIRESPIYTNSWVAAAGFGEGDERDERQGREMRDRGERVRDKGQNKGEKVDKILLFFYNTCYSAILCLELHCSSIVKKFAILLFSIFQCIWF